MTTTTVGRFSRISDRDFMRFLEHPPGGCWSAALEPDPRWVGRLERWLSEHYPGCFVYGDEILGPATYKYAGDFQEGTPPRQDLPPLPGDGGLSALYDAFVEYERAEHHRREEESEAQDRADVQERRETWQAPGPNASCADCGAAGLAGWDEADWGGGPPPVPLTLLLPFGPDERLLCPGCTVAAHRKPTTEPDSEEIAALNALIEEVFLPHDLYRIDHRGRLERNRRSGLGHEHTGLFLDAGGTAAPRGWLSAASDWDHYASEEDARRFESLFLPLAGRHMTDSGPFDDDGWPVVDGEGICTGGWVAVGEDTPEDLVPVRWEDGLGRPARVEDDNPDAFCSDFVPE